MTLENFLGTSTRQWHAAANKDSLEGAQEAAKKKPRNTINTMYKNCSWVAICKINKSSPFVFLPPSVYL